MQTSNGGGSDSDDEYIGYVVDVYESERKYPLSGFGEKRLPGDPPRFTNYLFNVNRPLEQVSKELPLHCKWLSEWAVSHDKGTDADGWMYGKEFKDAPSDCKPKDDGSSRIRKRLWRRVFQVMEQFEEESVLFAPLFRSVIMDQCLGNSDITADLIKQGDSAGRPRSIATRSHRSQSTTGSTISSHPLCFLYIKDEDAPKCMNNDCGKVFTLVRRRHHCMSCGRIYCGSCSPKREEFNNTRVCKLCLLLEDTRILEMDKLSHLIEATVNLEGGTRDAISDMQASEMASIEERELLARIHQLNIEDEMILRTDHETKEERQNHLIDIWEAKRAKGGRSGAATVTITECMNISKLGPSVWIEISHASNPSSTHRSEPYPNPNPKYKYTAYTLVADDREPFIISVIAKGKMLSKPKQVAQVSFYSNEGNASRKANVKREAHKDGQYVERGDEDLTLLSTSGSKLESGLMVSWKIDFRDKEPDRVDFCTDCHHMLDMCICEETVRKRRLEAERLQALKDERDIFMARERRRAQVNRDRIAKGLPPQGASRSMIKFRGLTKEAELGLMRRYYHQWGVSLRNYLLAKQKEQQEAAAAEKKRLDKAKAKEEDQRMDKAALEAIAKRKAQMMGLVGFAASKMSGGKGSKADEEPPTTTPASTNSKQAAAQTPQPTPEGPKPTPVAVDDDDDDDDDVHPAVRHDKSKDRHHKGSEKKGRRRGQRKVDDGGKCCTIQ